MLLSLATALASTLALARRTTSCGAVSQAGVHCLDSQRSYDTGRVDIPRMEPGRCRRSGERQPSVSVASHASSDHSLCQRGVSWNRCGMHGLSRPLAVGLSGNIKPQVRVPAVGTTGLLSGMRRTAGLVGDMAHVAVFYRPFNATEIQARYTLASTSGESHAPG